MTVEHEHVDVRELLKTALINAHALESQGLAVLDKQLSSLDASPSTLKDLGLAAACRSAVLGRPEHLLGDETAHRRA